MARPQTIAELAEAIADGKTVDWASAESSAPTEWERAAIRRLKRIGQVSDQRRHPAASAQPAIDAEATVAVAPAEQRWGHLSILEPVGEGAFGQVYRAHDPKLARDVALKLLREPTLANGRTTAVIEEGRLLARIRHPNVVTVYGADNHDGRAGIWMEFLRGRTLERVLREHGRFGAHEAALIGIDLARALAAVHAAGLVHRDVKAQNVMREDGGRLVLMDFGTGRERELVNDAVSNLTGTPLYLAPEVLEGESATIRSDIYSLGVLLYHLVTDSYPVVAATLRGVIEAHRGNARTRLRDARPDLPAAFVQVVERATAADPQARYATAGELEAALTDAIAGERQVPLPAPVPRGWVGGLRDRIVAHPLIALAVSVVIVMAVAGAAWRVRTSSGFRIPPGGRAVVLIVPFDNHTDQPNLPTSLGLRLNYEFVNSKWITAVPQSSIDKVLKLMGDGPGTNIDVKLAQQISVRDGGIDAYIAGVANQIGSSYALDAEIFSAVDGHLVASAAATAASTEDLLGAVQRLSDSIREKLGESRADIKKGHQQQEKQVTTPSFDAWTAYSQAYMRRMNSNDDWKLSLQFVEDALRYDHDFAMAHIWRAWALRNLGHPKEEFLAEADLAVALGNTVQPWERYWIEGSEAWFRKDTSRAIEKWRALLEIDPTHDWALNNLLNYLTMHGDPHEVLKYAVRAAESRPYDVDSITRASIAAEGAGDAVVARQFAARRQALAASFHQWDLANGSWTIDAWELWRQGDLPGALRSLNRTVTSLENREPAVRASAVTELTYYYLALGRTHDLEKVARLSDNSQSRSFVMSMAAYWRGDDAMLREQLPAKFEVAPSRPPDHPTLCVWPQEPQFWTLMLLRAGHDSDAELWVADREARFRAGESHNDFPTVLRARILAKQGLVPEALTALDRAPEGVQGSPLDLYDRAGILAELLVRQHNLDRAAETLRKAPWKPTDSNSPALSAALAMENFVALMELDRQVGNYQEAAATEQELRRLLAVADPDFVLARRLGIKPHAP